MSALGRALSLAAVPQVVVRDLPTPVRPVTPPTVSPDVVELHRSPSAVPSLEDLLLEEEHEVSVRRRRARRKRAHDSAAKTRRRSIRLAAKEDPFYVDATAKATRVKAAQLDLARAFARMKDAIASSGVLHRPAPAKISLSKLRCLGRACGLPDLPDSDGDEATVACCPARPCTRVVSVLLEDVCVRHLDLFFRFASLLPLLRSYVLPGLMPCSAGGVVGLRGRLLCSVCILGALGLMLCSTLVVVGVPAVWLPV